MMQIQFVKNLNPGRFELGTTLSQPNRYIKSNVYVLLSQNLLQVLTAQEIFKERYYSEVKKI